MLKALCCSSNNGTCGFNDLLCNVDVRAAPRLGGGLACGLEAGVSIILEDFCYVAILAMLIWE